MCTTNIVLDSNVTLRLYPGTQVSGPCTILLNSHTSIEGSGGIGMYVDPQSSIIWGYTGPGNFISLAPGANNVRLANVMFNGNPAASDQNGFFASPGPAYSPSNVGVTLDHVTFRQFSQDGIHLEDNIYMVDCFRCAATDNGRYGWYQAPQLSAVAPNQVDIFSGRFNRNVVAQVYAAGGKSAGTLHIWGGSISSELYPVVFSNCAEFYAGSDQQLDVDLV